MKKRFKLNKIKQTGKEGEVPADEVDDSVVFEVGVCWAGTTSFVRQLQNVVLV